MQQKTKDVENQYLVFILNLKTNILTKIKHKAKHVYEGRLEELLN